MKQQSLNERAMNLLARREHSVAELTTKLLKANFDIDDINTVISKLKSAGLQSDQRFAENYLRYRSQRGFGSQRIRLELKERGVADEIINNTLKEASIDWFSIATTVRCKRFGEQYPDDYKDRAKQQRFLQYRGFTHEQITESFNAEST
ncbi:MAG: recombination regulator RecX [Gammaproteobacteria bacterium]|nr:recombination regulator RecX [Gammaproteobacteria bacterium]MDH5592208.1 recombination regulator RecX [Gammaproteobacteria bacterium]